MPGEHDQTIAALATPPGEAGIAVIRISGTDALAILDAIFRTKDGRIHESAWKHRRLYHGVVRDDRGSVIDEVMADLYPDEPREMQEPLGPGQVAR